MIGSFSSDGPSFFSGGASFFSSGASFLSACLLPGGVGGSACFGGGGSWCGVGVGAGVGSWCGVGAGSGIGCGGFTACGPGDCGRAPAPGINEKSSASEDEIQ